MRVVVRMYKATNRSSEVRWIFKVTVCTHEPIAQVQPCAVVNIESLVVKVVYF